MNWETLLCLGDSITIGSRTYLGYPEHAGLHLEKKLGNKWNVINHATCGFKAIDLHRSVTQNFQVLQQFQPSLATIMVGTNDLKSPTHLDDFRAAYQQLVLKTQLILGNNNVFLIKVPKLPPTVKYPYKAEMNVQVAQFNQVIESIGKAQNLKVIDLVLKDTDLFDGVHLNDQGVKSFGLQLAQCILTDKGLKPDARTANL
jgi:lysophospholipase L1-like esterase